MKPEGLDMEAIYLRTHQRLFNQPYVEGGVDTPKADDPCGLRTVALRMFQDLRFDDFIPWAITACPDWQESDVASHLIGVGHFYANRPWEAERHLARALEMRLEQGKTDAADTMVVMGEVYRDLGRRDLVWKYLNEAYKVAPRHIGVHVNRFCLASVERNKGQLEEVYERMDACYLSWPRNTELCNRLSQDGELAYLRSTSVWSKMVQKMQDA